MLGIYCYKDSKIDEIVYIGKDSHIEQERRNKAHYHKSNRDMQVINKVLQDNPNRYDYQVLSWNVNDHQTLNKLEIEYISKLNPKFNFTIGGEGVTGYKHSDERKEKMRKAKLGRKLSDETKQKMSENHPKYWLGKKRSNETIQKIIDAKKGTTHSDETKIKMSKAHNTTGFFRVYKVVNKRCKQGFTFVYSYYENFNRKYIRNVNLKKLEEIVKSKGLKWFIVDETKANNTLNEWEMIKNGK